MQTMRDPSSNEADKRLWHRWWPWLIVSAAVLATLALLALALVVLPPLLVPRGKPSFADLAKAESDVRGNLVATLGVLAVLIGGAIGFLNFRETQRQNQLARQGDRDQLELTRRGQVTERFGRAIEQLGQSEADQLDVRLGAIYALEQIARDSAELHWPIMEVLTAHLREYRRIPLLALEAEESTAEPPEEPRLPAEAQAIATVIGRRRHEQDPPNQRLDLHEVDLSGVVWEKAQLQGANLIRAHLEGANLDGAHLERARLLGAQLRRVILWKAHLERANLTGAQLQGTTLLKAQLQGAKLDWAQLQGANLSEAQLDGASLSVAQLKGVDLFKAQLQGADLFGTQLEGANLYGARLQGANLSGTNLNSANLQGADLTDARNLTWVQVKAATNGDQSKLPTYLVAQRAAQAAPAASAIAEEPPPEAKGGEQHSPG